MQPDDRGGQVNARWKAATATTGIMLLIAPAQGSNWVKVGDTSTAYVYIDTESIVPRGQYRQAWLLWDWLQDKQTTTYPQKVYKSSKYLTAFDCARRSSLNVQVVHYSDDTGAGEVVESRAWSIAPDLFADVVPDSIGEMMLGRVCSHLFGRPSRNKSLPQKP